MTIKLQVFDFFKAEHSQRKMTDEGYLVMPGKIARTGIQDYHNFELGLPGSPLDTVRIYRPAEEVFNADSMASFEHKPVTIGHPSELVTADNWASLSKGEVRDVARDGEFMSSILIVKAKDAIEKIDRGTVQLSNGYTCDLDMTPGITPDGMKYDGVQRNIRGNHVALVDAARCGSACRVADSKPDEGVKMKTTIKGVPFEIADASAHAAIEQVVAENATLTADSLAYKELKGKSVKLGDKSASLTDAAAVQALLDTANATIADLQKQVITPEKRDALVADWALMKDNAKKLHPEIVTDGKTCHAIRKEVIAHAIASDATAKAQAEAILGSVALDAASEDSVRTVFNVLSATAKDSTEVSDAGQNQSVAAAIVGDAGNKANDGATVLVGREKFLDSLSKGLETTH
jgi:hypothetical protein